MIKTKIAKIRYHKGMDEYIIYFTHLTLSNGIVEVFQLNQVIGTEFWLDDLEYFQVFDCR